MVFFECLRLCVSGELSFPLDSASTGRVRVGFMQSENAVADPGAPYSLPEAPLTARIQSSGPSILWRFYVKRGWPYEGSGLRKWGTSESMRSHSINAGPCQKSIQRL